MTKIAYVIDSTLISKIEEIDGTDIFIQPLHVMVNDEVFDDLIGMSSDAFYQAYLDGATASTSQPAPGEFAKTYEMLKEKGYTDIITCTISSGLSGTYNSANLGAELVEGINVHVVDTKLCGAVGIKIVKKVIEEAANNKKMTIDAIIARIQKIAATAKIYIYIGDLDALKKGGRLSAVGAFVGTMLQIKPLVTLTETGELEIAIKERTEKKGLKRTVQIIENHSYNHAMILQTSNIALREKLEAIFVEEHPDMAYDLENLSPVIGTHIGTEGTAIFVWEM